MAENSAWRSDRRRLLPGLVVCLAPFLAGCSYLERRAGDLSDVVRFELGWPAVGAYVHATPLLGTGLDLWTAYPVYGATAGNYQSRVPGQGELGAYSLVLWHARGYDTRPEDRDPANPDDFPAPDAGAITQIHRLHWPFEEAPSPEVLEPIHWLDLEADVALGVGLRLRLSPGQLADFVLGWFGLDIAGDDAVPGRRGPDRRL